MLFQPGILCSISLDKMIQFRDIQNDKSIYRLELDCVARHVTLTREGEMVTAGDDCIVRFWNGEEFESRDMWGFGMGKNWVKKNYDFWNLCFLQN